MGDVSWSAVTLRVEATDETPLEVIVAALGPARRGGRHWLRFFEGAGDTLEHRLARAADFMVANEMELSDLSKRTAVTLAVAFTPKEPQDGFCFPAGMIRRLADLNADVRVDTYIG